MERWHTYPVKYIRIRFYDWLTRVFSKFVVDTIFIVVDEDEEHTYKGIHSVHVLLQSAHDEMNRSEKRLSIYGYIVDKSKEKALRGHFS